MRIALSPQASLDPPDDDELARTLSLTNEPPVQISGSPNDRQRAAQLPAPAADNC